MKRIYKAFTYLFVVAPSCFVLGQSVSTPCYNTGEACNANVNKYNPNPSPVVNNGNGTLGVLYNSSSCGLNYVHGDVLIERRSAKAITPFNINGTGNPSSVTIAGLPNCYVIDKAYLWLSMSYTSAAPPALGLTITNPAAGANSYALTRIGQDGEKCWAEVGSAAYRADVTANITGNGVYQLNITGYANAGDEVDGATLLIIYKDIASTYQGSLVIWDGITTSGNFNSAPANRGVDINGFFACATSTYANAFLIVADMQASVNGGIHSTTLNGATANYPNNFWNFDIANTTVNAAQGTSTFRANGGGSDCFSVVVEGLYYQTTACVTCVPAQPLVLSNSTTPALCGACDGTASVNASGGTAPYKYLWSGSGQTTQTATGLCAGSYIVTVVDSSGCFSSKDTVTIAPTGAMTANIASFIDPACAASCNGSASAGQTGGISPFTYLWSSSSQTTQTATGLCAGTYSVLITDSGQCSSIAVVTITDPSAVNSSVSNTSVSCNGNSDGTATVTPGGGTGAYTYLWSNNQTTQTATSLTAGSYSIIVSDAGGCTTLSTTVIAEPVALTSISSATDATCNGAGDGSASVSPAGGTGAYTYLWSNMETISSISGLMAGTYSVIISDSNGCTTVSSAIVNEPPALTLSPSFTDIKCNGGSDGTASVSPLGGTGTYSYLWNNGETTQSISSLIAGTYTVIVSDNNNCTTTTSVNITDPPLLTASIPLVNTICISQNATLNVNTVGGTPNFNYVWSSGQTGNPVSVSPTTTTTYSVLVSDGNGCTTTSSIVVDVNPPLSVITNGGAPVCSGQSVAIGVTANGGNGGPYNYSWSPTSNVVCPACQNTTVNPPSSLTYTVTVSDNCGSPVVSDSVVVTINPLPIVSMSSPITICSGASTQLTCGTTGTFTSVWNPQSGLSDPNISNPIATPTATTTYYVILTDANGCSRSGSVLVTLTPPPVADAGTDVDICLGETTQLFASGGVNYSWTPSTGLSQTNVQNPIATPSSTTSYIVSVSKNTICPPDSDSVVVFVHPPPVLDAGIDTTIMAGDSANLIASGSGTSWLWSPSTGLSCFTCIDPIANPLKTTTYIVISTDSFGCRSQDTIVVIVDDVLTLYIPNAFTPFNHDANNNIFYSYGTGISQFEFTVFNRWGEIIFKTNDPQSGWDGSHNGQMVLQDVYGYIAKAISLTGRSIIKTGSITVVR